MTNQTITTGDGSSRARPINPKKTAILIVDAQQGICKPKDGLPEKEFENMIFGTAVPNLKLLIKSARKTSVEVIYTVIQSLTLDGRDRSLDYKISGFHFPPDSEEVKIISELEANYGEIIIPKTSSSLFNSTNFDYILRNIGITTIIIGGFQTDQCIDHTIRDGADLGYNMVCAVDSCAAKTNQKHLAAIDLFKGYCRLASTDLLIQEMSQHSER